MCGSLPATVARSQRLQNISSNSTSWSKTLPRSMPATPMKRMLSAYLLALISGTHGGSRLSGQPQQLRDLGRRQHQLEHAAVGGVPAGAAVLAQQAQDDRRARRGSAANGSIHPAGRAAAPPAPCSASSDRRAGRTRTRRRESPVRCLIAISHSFSRRCVPTLPACASRCALTCSISSSSAVERLLVDRRVAAQRRRAPASAARAPAAGRSSDRRAPRRR